MLGKPTFDCGNGGTSVPSFSRGTRESGGFTPRVDHASRSCHNARCTCSDWSGLRNCWQLPLDSGLPGPPCCLLASKYTRELGWSGKSFFPVGSVLISEPAFTQNSLAE